MSKDELKILLDSITIGEIESFEIKYKREKSYGIYDERHRTQTITYNK